MISLLRTPARTMAGFLSLQAFKNLTLIPACDGATADDLPVPPESKLQPGEAGLCESWRRAAALIVRSGAPWAFVFEDDAVPLRETDSIISAVSAVPHGWDFIKLDDGERPEPAVVEEGEVFRRVSPCSWKTEATAISQSGAVKILRGLAPYVMPIDEWLRQSDVTVWQPMPGLAYFGQAMSTPSTVRGTTMSGEIPHHIHQIWCGPDSLTPELGFYMSGWNRHHSGWTYTLWGNDEIKELFGGAVPWHLGPAGVSDIARLMILHRHGGLYADADFECFHPFDALIAAGSCLIADIEPGVPCNGLMAASKGHPLLASMLAQVAQREGQHILHHAGPEMVKDVIAPWRDGAFEKPVLLHGSAVADAVGDTGLVIIRPKTLFPYRYTEKKPAVMPATAWAAHHWARSWWGEKEWTEFRESNPQLA